MPQKRILPVLSVVALLLSLTSTDNWLQTTSVFGQASPVATSRPTPRASDQMMTYDEGTVLLFVTKVGDESAGKPWGATELWEWDGKQWAQLK